MVAFASIEELLGAFGMIELKVCADKTLQMIFLFLARYLGR
jgi:hypothetical protein